jgi:hypothetical protein
MEEYHKSLMARLIGAVVLATIMEAVYRLVIRRRQLAR